MLSVVQVWEGEHKGRQHSGVKATSRIKERSKLFEDLASQGLRQNDAFWFLSVFGKVQGYRLGHKQKCYTLVTSIAISNPERKATQKPVFLSMAMRTCYSILNPIVFQHVPHGDGMLQSTSNVTANILLPNP